MKNTIKILSAVFFLNIAMLSAEEAKHGEHGKETAGHEEHAEHANHNNHFSIFLGMTSTLEVPKTNDFTAGLDYEYRLPIANRLFGLGVLADFAFGAETKAVFAGFIGIHPVGGLKILLAPGVEMLFGAHPHQAFLLRGSIGYDFMINNFSITPIVSVDFLPETKAVSLVYGLAAGIGF